jgi:NAD-dependent dihydropyrimidine dehydrogenase PreA subunit
MAYVIVDSCIKDFLCVDACPVECIHPRLGEPNVDAVAQLFVDPAGCIDCGACVPACDSDAIFAESDLKEEQQKFIEINARYYA